MASQVWKLSLSFIPAASYSAMEAFWSEAPAVEVPTAWRSPAHRTAQSLNVAAFSRWPTKAPA